MIIRKAFKFELMPKGEHSRKLKQFCGCSRFVFNQALAWQKAQYQQDNTIKFSYTKLANLLPKWKGDDDWLKTYHSQVLQQSLKDLESAYHNFFRKQSDFAKFKKEGGKESIRFPQRTKLDENNKRIFIPKVGYIRYRQSQFIAGVIKNVTVRLVCGKWFVSIQTEYEQAEPIHQSNTEIGIDMGINRFATLSNGTYFEPLNIFKQNQIKLKK
jgi:putative transposase